MRWNWERGLIDLTCSRHRSELNHSHVTEVEGEVDASGC